MKEFIDKLISRLEEVKEKHQPTINGKTTMRDLEVYKMTIGYVKEIVNELAEEYKGKYVGIGAFEQVRCERDIAIEQLHELGYEFGQKIDKVSEMPTGSEDCCEWRLIDYEANVYDTTCRNPHILLEGSPTDNSYEFCPYCGKKIKVAPYTEGE